MTASDGAGFHSQPERPDHGSLLFLVAVFVLLHTFIVLQSDQSVADFRFTDTDAYSRMVRVQDLLESGDWFDSSYRRVNPPLGLVSHWTRPMDAVILAETKLLTLFLDDETALHWAGVTIGPVLHLLSLFVVVLGTRPLFGNMYSTLCGLLFLVQPPLVQSFIMGRPDHQSLQLLMALLTILLAAHILLRPFNRLLCYSLGATFALAVWTSVETILPVAGALAGLTLAWVIWRRDFARKSVYVLLAAVGGLLVALALERSPQEIATLPLEADRLSFLHVALFAVPLGFWLVVHSWDRTRGAGESGIATRAAVVAAGGVMALGLLGLARPGILAGKVASVDPLYTSTRSGLISESQPAYLPGSFQTFGISFVVTRIATYFGYALAGAMSLAYLLAHPRAGRRELWLTIAVIFGVVMLFILRNHNISLRWGPVLGLILLFPYAEIVTRLYEKLSDLTTRGAEVLRAVSLLMLVLWPLGLIRALEAGDSKPQTKVVTQACPVTEISRYLAAESPWRDRPRRIMAFADFGPEILYRTRHSVFSIPNHRLQPGYTDTFRTMAATRDNDARAIVARREVDLILICRSRSLSNYFRRGIEAPPADQSIFRERLLRGQIPDWLRPIVLPDGLDDGFLLLEVDRTAMPSR